MTTLSIAPDCDGAHQRFRITHPFHPLHGKEFELLSYRRCWGEERVYFHDEQGTLKTLPAEWTSVVVQDPVVVMSAGRSCLRVEDLLRMVELVRRNRSGASKKKEGRDQADL